MLTRSVSLPSMDGQPWRIYIISDAHIGDVSCDEDGLRDYIRTIEADPKGRVLITGDLISAIGKGDKRLDLSSLADWVLATRPRVQQDILGVQAERAVDWLRPVADRIDAVVCGNHEYRPRAWYGRDIMREIAKDLDCKDAYLGSQGWLTYQFVVTATRRRRYDILLHHGIASGKGVTPEAPELYRILCDYDVDMAIVGHSHRRGPYPPWQRVYRDAKTGRLGLRELWGVVGGTWQRTPDTGDQWSDERRLRPRSTGGVVIQYNPADGTIRVSA